MSEDTQKPNHPTVESMVYKMFRYQQRQKYWKIAKFSFLALFITSIGLGIFRQVNQSLTGLTKGTAVSQKLIEQPHISLVELRGGIWGSFETTTPSTVDFLMPALRRAFQSPNTVAVVLRINSPGGSPMQSGEIYNEIRYLRQQYPKIPIYAVCEEVCASAAYYIASACDAIYANSMSQVGSLGVVFDGFGYTELMKKLGIERRVITAGNKKHMLDPFSPLKEEDVKMLKELQSQAHQEFINAVKQGRGDRLKDLEKNSKELFSGRIWLGKEALALGLIDGLGSMDTLARELKASIINYTPQPDILSQFKKAAGLKMSAMLNEKVLTAKLAEPLLSEGISAL